MSILNDIKNDLKSTFDFKNKFEFKNTIGFNNDVCNIYIYNEILNDEWEENSPQSILYQLNSYNNLKEINLYINSPGGSVSAGWAICNIINRKRAEGTICNVYIDGFACSIASVIAISTVDKLYMYDNSLIMVHLPSCMAYGNKVELEKAISDLEKIELQLKSIYKSRAKETLTDEILDNMIKNETWLNASDVELYFDIPLERKNTINNKTILSVDGYKNVLNISDDKLTFAYKKKVDELNNKITLLKIKEINDMLSKI